MNQSVLIPEESKSAVRFDRPQTSEEHRSDRQGGRTSGTQALRNYISAVPNPTHPQAAALTHAFVGHLNRADRDELLALFTEDATFIDRGIELEIAGKEGLSAFLTELFTSYPGAVREIDAVYTEGKTTVAEWRCSATQEEPFLFGQTRNLRIEFHGVSIIQAVKGRIVHMTEYYDKGSSRREAFAFRCKPSPEY